MALFDPSTVTNLMGPVQAGQQYQAMQGQQIQNTRNMATLPTDIAESQARSQMMQQQTQQNAALFPNAMQQSNLGVQGAQLDLASKKINGAIGLLYMANDPESWSMMRNKAGQMGFDPSIIPEKFDPAWKQQAIMGMMPMKDRIDMQLKMREQNLGATGKAAEMSGSPNMPLEAATNGMSGLPPAATGSGAPMGAGMPSGGSAGLRAPEQVEGAKVANKNYQDEKSGLSKQVSEGADSIRIINAQEQLLKNFKAGAWTTDRANYANMAMSMGLPETLVKMIANADNPEKATAATEAFEGMASQHALLQAKSLAQGGTVGQKEFLQFKADLADPDKREGAIKAINDLQRQTYQTKNQQLQFYQKLEDAGVPAGKIPALWADKQFKQLNGGEAEKAAQTGGGTAPNPRAVAFLKANPNARVDFDRKFGPGAAAKVLGQ